MENVGRNDYCNCHNKEKKENISNSGIWFRKVTTVRNFGIFAELRERVHSYGTNFELQKRQRRVKNLYTFLLERVKRSNMRYLILVINGV